MRRIALALFIVTAVFAVTEITFDVPDDKLPKIIAAFEAQDGSHVHITFNRSPDPEDPNDTGYSASVDIDPGEMGAQDPNETLKQYGKRRIGAIAHAFVVAEEIRAGNAINAAAHAAIPPVDVNDITGIE